MTNIWKSLVVTYFVVFIISIIYMEQQLAFNFLVNISFIKETMKSFIEFNLEEYLTRLIVEGHLSIESMVLITFRIIYLSI